MGAFILWKVSYLNLNFIKVLKTVIRTNVTIPYLQSAPDLLPPHLQIKTNQWVNQQVQVKLENSQVFICLLYRHKRKKMKVLKGNGRGKGFTRLGLKSRRLGRWHW